MAVGCALQPATTWEWEINGKARLFATPRIAQNMSENRHTA